MPVAVVSMSIGVRFIVSTMALLNRGIRAFGPSELDAAMACLELTEKESSEVRRAVDMLGEKLGGRE